MKRIIALALAIALVGIATFVVPASAEDGTTAQVLQPGSTQVLVGPNGDPIVIVVTDPAGHVTVTINGDVDVTVNGESVRTGSWVVPTPAPDAAAPSEGLWGSCTVAAADQFNLRWYGGRDNVLQFNHQTDDLRRLNELHKTNSVSCNLQPVPFPVRVEADARAFDLQPGQGWGFTWDPGEFTVGFLARKR